MRLLHTADWQLGRRFGQFASEPAAILADARFSTITAINQLALEKSVDVILVAGDVFDSNQLSDADILRGFSLICESPCEIVLLPGNHDADCAGSVWERIVRERKVPANVHIVRAGKSDALVLLNGALAVLSAPLGQVRADIDHLSLFARQRTAQSLASDCIVVGLAHGSVQGKLPPGAEVNNPIAADLASLAKLDYLGLGDWHGYLTIDSKTCYSGTPEPDRFRNNTKGQVLLVDVQAGMNPHISPINVAQFDWLELPLIASGSDTAASLMAKIFEGIAKQTSANTAEQLRKLVLRLKLSGTLSLPARIEFERGLAELRAQIRQLSYLETALRTSLEPASYATLISQFADASYVQNVARTLFDELADPDPALAMRASDALVYLHQLSQQT